MNRGAHGRMPESELDVIALKRLAAKRDVTADELAMRSGLRATRIRDFFERSDPLSIDDAAIDALSRALHVGRDALVVD